MRTSYALACLAALLASGCAYRHATILTNPETMESRRCDRIAGTPVGVVSVSLAAAVNSQYGRCIEALKQAGFLMPAPTGTDFMLDKSLYVTAVRDDARRLGLRVGDRVLRIDGFDLSVPSGRRSYFEHLATKKPGDMITAVIERGDGEMELRLPLPKHP